ncbi:putative uncharacterized protein DDB_G0282133 [Condylostylus longicornis]|uniref:putative uncharacterized protein DDB_G0282133 n=1 Tax=Condylostylus longicornis TaxID=2530218 RepID=UPI00244E306C|nr:putative uncharacterized protein DDB_G0282133 [Condylostylus longicornis]
MDIKNNENIPKDTLTPSQQIESPENPDLIIAEIPNSSSNILRNNSNTGIADMKLRSTDEKIQKEVEEGSNFKMEKLIVIGLNSTYSKEDENFTKSENLTQTIENLSLKIDEPNNDQIPNEINGPHDEISKQIPKESKMDLTAKEILSNDLPDGNLINKIKINENIENSSNYKSISTDIDPKVMQYLKNIPPTKLEIIKNNEEISSFSDSNIEIPLKKSTTKLALPSSSQIKAGVKKSYSCIGKFNQEPIDKDDFYYKVVDKKLIKENKKLNDDTSANESCNSDSQSSSNSSSSPKLLRDKTMQSSIRPKSTPASSSTQINSILTPGTEKKLISNASTSTTGGGSNGGGSNSSGAPIMKRESFIRQSFNRLFRKSSSASANSNNLSTSSNSSNSSCNSEKINNTNSVEKFFNSVMGNNDSSGSGSSSSGGGNNTTVNNNNKKDKTKANHNSKQSDFIDDFEEILNNLKNDNINSSNNNNNENNMKFLKPSLTIFKDYYYDNKTGIRILIEKVPSESDLTKLKENSNSTLKEQILGVRKNHSFNLHKKRSTNNVNIGIRSTTDSPMAPLQGQSETNGQSIINLSTLNKNHNHYQSSNNLNQNNNSNNLIYNNNNNNNNNNNSNNNNFNTNNNNLNNGTSLKADSKFQRQLSSSPIIASSSEISRQITVITPTSSTSGSGSGQQQTQSTQNYQQQQSQERSGRSISPHPIKSQSTSSVLSVINDTKSNTSVTTSKNEIPEKEKKRKELSSSRKKKFHRHFQQVSKDERILNYFSCALVSDILLQGHLYITENYFAFYSNVFGFVTKLLIPTSSVMKISKEKTAKIIPNAVGVTTYDERHVFGSFMSREAAYRLMCSVCPPLEAAENIIISPKVPDAEICEEYSVEDDSSCSISGNESPALLKAGDSGGNCGNTTTASSDASHTLRHRPISASTNNVTLNDTRTDSDLLNIDNGGENKIQLIIGAGTPIKVLKPNQSLPIMTAATSTSIGYPLTPEKSVSSTSCSGGSSFRNVKDKLISLIHFKFPTEVHVVYIGIFLAVMLTIFSLFLMFRILDIEAKASYRSTIDISNKWSSSDDDNNDNIYAEALKWQKELQVKSTEEAQSILSNNLELIARVRKSLKALSMLINDRHTSSSSPSPPGFSNMGYDTTNDESIDDHIASS